MCVLCWLFAQNDPKYCCSKKESKLYLIHFKNISHILDRLANCSFITKPHFYMVKLGFIGVYMIFLISTQKHILWVLVRTSTHNLCFGKKCEKYQIFLSEHFQYLEVKFYIYLNRRVFVMLVCAYWFMTGSLRIK